MFSYSKSGARAADKNTVAVFSPTFLAGTKRRGYTAGRFGPVQ